MKILQAGYPKSGNFWLYQIIKNILQTSNIDHTSFIEKHPVQLLAKDWKLGYPEQSKIDVIDITDLQVIYRISSIFRMPIDDFEDYLSGTNHVWTHSPICKRSSSIYKYFEKKVVIIRDPRDMVISAANYFCSDYMLKYFPQPYKDPDVFLRNNFDRLLREWVWHVYDHLKLQKELNIHTSFFEGFLENFDEELSLLLNYLKIDLTETEKEEVRKAVAFSTLKKKNSAHLRKGKSGSWMDRLTKDQISRASVIAGPLIRYLGYPEMGGEMSYSRNFPHYDFEKLKEEIIHSQKEPEEVLPDS